MDHVKRFSVNKPPQESPASTTWGGMRRSLWKWDVAIDIHTHNTLDNTCEPCYPPCHETHHHC
jgi:hypothetical protein